MQINRTAAHAAASQLPAPPARRYPDRRVLESQLAHLPIVYPPDGQLQIASIYLETPLKTLEEFHVVYVAGQEDAATNAIGQWWASVSLDLTTAAAQELVRQVRLAERGRKIREQKEREAKAAEAERQRKERVRKTSSDSIFRKYQGDQQRDMQRDQQGDQ